MNKSSTIQHLAIIPDGNRRWAKKHTINAQGKMYKQGAERANETIKTAFEYGISNVTIWASSYSNLSERSKGIVQALEVIYDKLFKELIEEPIIHQQKVHINVFGQWRQFLKSDTVDLIQKALDTTSSYNQKQLTILIGYDGQAERGAAIKAILKDSQANLISIPEDIKSTDKLLRSYSWTGFLPDVDLIIRTGAWEDPHNSAAFLSLLTTNSQYSFPELLWPDFDKQALIDTLNNFTNRERRMGR